VFEASTGPRDVLVHLRDRSAIHRSDEVYVRAPLAPGVEVLVPDALSIVRGSGDDRMVARIRVKRKRVCR